MTTNIYNLIILDESGSMASIKNATIDAFNEVIQGIRHAAIEHRDLKQWIAFYTFNSKGITEVIGLQQVDTIYELKEEDYHPDAMTPLYDAIGHTSNRLRYAIENEKDYKVLVTIFTDGAENASREFTAITIRNMIAQLEESGWTFTYLGANHDVNKIAGMLNFKHKMSWQSSVFGVHHALKLDTESRVRFYKKAAANEVLNRDESYFDANAGVKKE